MANFTGTILTTRGRNLLAKALTGVPLTFTKVQLGSGVWSQNTNPENLTSLVEPRIDLPVQSLQVVGDGTARLRFVLTNQNITEGFFLREIGVFANDPQLGEILYSVAYASNPDFIPSRNTTAIELVVDIYVVVANAQQVNITLSDTIVLATRQDVDRVASGVGIQDGAITISKISSDVYSLVPAANRIPMANNSGKLALGWLPDTFSAYSRLQVGSALPSSSNEGDLFYRTSDMKLFIRRASEWLEVDWQRLVQASPDWIAGILRIQNGQLQISPDGTNWYNCIPAVGANSIELASVDNTNYTQLYWIPPGTTAIVRNANHLPLVYTPAVEPVFWMTWWNNVAYDYQIGLRPNNTAISDGGVLIVWGETTAAKAARATSLSIFPIIDQSNTTENWGSAWVQVRSNQRFLGNSVGQSGNGYEACITAASGTASTTSYWLGTWVRQDGVQFTMTRIAIKRVA